MLKSMLGVPARLRLGQTSDPIEGENHFLAGQSPVMQHLIDRMRDLVSCRLSLILAAAIALAAPSARADVSMAPDVEFGAPPALFSSGMVLQREMTVPIFGKASVGEQVTVTFNGQQKITTTGADGKWRVDLDPMSAGGPLTMTIEGNNTIVISNVRIGEVWIAAGQSNTRIKAVPYSVLALHPEIRTIVRTNWNDQPGLVPFDFAVELQQSLGVPVGILNLAIGGTSIVSWLGSWNAAGTKLSSPGPKRCGLGHARDFGLRLHPAAAFEPASDVEDRRSSRSTDTTANPAHAPSVFRITSLMSARR